MNEETIFSMNVSVRTSPDSVEIQRRELQAQDLGNYIVLREVLDLFERRLVEYFFAGADATERASRAEEIRLKINTIPNAVWAHVGEPCNHDSDCGSGEHCVNGFCQKTSGGNEPDVDEGESVAPAIAVTG